MILLTRPSDQILYGDSINYSYRARLERDLKAMAELVQQGHEIKWSANKKWCEVNGKTFNIAKRVWILRKDEFLTK